MGLEIKLQKQVKIFSSFFLRKLAVIAFLSLTVWLLGWRRKSGTILGSLDTDYRSTLLTRYTITCTTFPICPFYELRLPVFSIVCDTSKLVTPLGMVLWTVKHSLLKGYWNGICGAYATDSPKMLLKISLLSQT